MSSRLRRWCLATVALVAVACGIYFCLYHPVSSSIGHTSRLHYSQYDDYFASSVADGNGTNLPMAPQAFDAAARTGPSHRTVVSAAGKPALVLYSARYDSTRRSIVLVGYFNNRLGPPPRLFCRLADALPWQLATHHAMHEGHARPYDGVLYFCPAAGERTPGSHEAVQVRSGYPNKPSGFVVMPVLVAMATAHQQQPSRGVAACTTALRYVPGQETELRFILRLVEFIEVNRLLGVEHFYLYNWSLPANASRTLRHYIGLGWVSVSQWSLPAGLHPENDIHYFGQLVVTNDCLYAARDQHRLLAFIDVDEFLVPLGGSAGTLGEAAGLRGLQDGAGGYCALGFRHGLFPLMSDAQLANASSSWARLPVGLAGCHVTSLLYEQRAREVMPFQQRSKLLVVARQIKEMGIHFAWETWSGCGTRQLDPVSEGLLHHMRSWGPVELVDDVTMRRYAVGVVDAMTSARQRLRQLLGFDICR